MTSKGYYVGKKGKVYIIGAGPGDPGLLTLRAAECLQRADVVVYDYLVGGEILAFARDDAQLIYVGKKGGDHTVSQERLNQILVEEAQKGNCVARLKGGDPFIFGRGGEEAEILTDKNIPFEVIPGVTSAIAAPAYAGIPLTHRGFTSSVAFVTGHEDPTKEESRLDWQGLVSVGTLVFLMGVKNLPHIVDQLIRSGRAPATPAALVRWGTTPDQETISGTLEDIVREAEGRDFSPPAVFVVGDVVRLKEKLSWFEGKPLFGKGIVITRPEKQSAEFASLLYEAGARVIYFPTIEIVAPDDFTDLDRSVEHIESYDWIVFTSANGVKFFFQRFAAAGRDIRDLKGIKLCTIGPATASALDSYGLSVDIVPDDYISEGVVEAFAREDIRDKRVLLPRAEVARDVIPEGLTDLGAEVDVVVAYRTVSSGRNVGELFELIAQRKVDVVTFTSPSTVINFMDIIGEGTTLPSHIRIACIGPVTKRAAEAAGFTVDIMHEPYIIAGLVGAIEKAFSNEEGMK